MECSCLFVFTCLITWSFLAVGTHQLQSSQAQVLLQVQKHLEYPEQLRIWQNRSTDFCYQSSTTQVNVSCEGNVVTELRIIGDKPAKLSDFVGFAIPNQTLSESFSMDSFVTNLARLNTLRVLSLVSLGVWGPFPDKIRRLYSLEYLDLSSNYLFGSVPPKISTMLVLQTLKLDDNFLNESIPDSLGSFSNLTVLSLRNNKFEGSFPSSIQRIRTLTDLVLSGNELSGDVPSLDTLSNLNLLDLSGNNLESDLPSLPKGLVMAFLNNNSFSGEILKQYSELNQLQHLDLSFNKLSGKPPAKVFSLPDITYLNLASNVLSGSLQDSINCGSKLQFVDISNNRLIGGLPRCLMTKSDRLVVNYGGNCLSVGLHNQHSQSSCLEVEEKEERSGGKNVAILLGVISGILVVVILLALGFIVLCRRIWPRAVSEQHLLHKSVQDNSANIMSSEIFTSARYAAETAKLATEGLPACRSFTVGELKEATNNFDSRFIIGEGSYGKLYKGKLENGTQVAIRCLPSSKKYTIRNLKLRLDLLSKLRHPHLVCLLGHCMDGQDDYRVNKVFLIYEYVSGGNFRSQLSEESSGRILSWSKRLSVLIEVAKAVHFLHAGVIPGFFSNRLKANNILFNDRGMPKLSDYGLSIISDELGSRDETGEGHRLRQMTRLDNDVYGFGLILLEALLGPTVAAKEDKAILEELASCNSQDGLRKLISPVVLATCSQESLSTVISITNKCISSESWSPPSFEDILWNLQYAAQIQATADSEQGLHS